MKIFICGSRTLTDRKWIFAKLDSYVREKGLPRDAEILEGEAQGVDLLAKDWAEKRGYKVLEYPADWNKFHFKAGFIRNEQMAKDCDAVVLLWTGKSSGTFHDIMMAKKYSKPYSLYLYNCPKDFEERIADVLENHKEILDEKDVMKAFKKFKNLVGLQFFS